jgi:hypothetical protein
MHLGLDAPADITLAGQPSETAQLVGCGSFRLLPSPVTCQYGGGPVLRPADRTTISPTTISPCCRTRVVVTSEAGWT